jgi:ribonucleoside-diphosphate reductase alpha chain
MAKEGSTLSGLMDSFALVFSLSLQHGVPLTTLCSKLAHTGFDPSGWTGNADLGYAKSIMDYLARWLELQFLKSKQGVLFETKPATAPVSAAPTTSTGLASSDSPACPDCGALTVRNGSCFKCMECGSTTGCS